MARKVRQLLIHYPRALPPPPNKIFSSGNIGISISIFLHGFDFMTLINHIYAGFMVWTDHYAGSFFHHRTHRRYHETTSLHLS